VRKRLLIAAVLLTSVLVWTGAAVTLHASWRLATALADATPLAEIGGRPQATVVYDRNGREAFSFYVEQRIDVPLTRVSPRMIDALLAVEDRRFYQHHGLDPVRIMKAAWRNCRAGRIVEGASTITQQLARMEQLTPARTFTRKIREAAIAVRLEERYSKTQILQAYLNTVYFGNGYYGVEAASRGYFGKAAADLEPQEAALLAGLVRSPAGYSPSASPKRALARRNLVLRLMRDNARLTDAEYHAATATPLRGVSSAALDAAATSCGRYYQEEVRRELVARFGGRRVLSGGLQVYTGYDPSMQCAAESTIDARIAQIARTRAAAKELEGSLVAIEPASGEVRALVGGRDFGSTSFIRATQARRQPGSAFKPIIYAAALERGLSPGSMLTHLDQPIMTARGPWLPGGDHEQTEYTLRAALKISSNRAAAQLLQQVGFGQAEYYAARLGVSSPLPSVPSLALGTGGVTLLELTSAYGVFANNGFAVSPHLIVRVDDSEGRSIWTESVSAHQAVTPTTAFLMSSMLSDVITSGTATAARAAGFKLPAAGKTGTTDNYQDAWFIGYTPHLVTGVWFGMDRPAPIMNRGFAAVVAVPAWAQFMKLATAKDAPDWFAPPSDLERVTICGSSGLLATDACRRSAAGQVYDEYFPIGSAPTDICPVHDALTLPAADLSVSLAAAVPVSTAGRIDRVVGPDGRVTWVYRQ
jgi:1A family penicillin-binding protein